MPFHYLFLGMLVGAIADPLAMVLTVVMMFMRPTNRALMVALGGTAAIIALTAVTVSGRYGRLPSDFLVEKAIGTLIWAGIGWGIGALVRHFLPKSPPPSDASRDPGPTTVAANRPATPSFAALSQHIVTLRRTSSIGQQLQATPGAIDAETLARDLAALDVMRVQLHDAKQPLDSDAAQRLDDIAARFDAAWQRQRNRPA